MTGAVIQSGSMADHDDLVQALEAYLGLCRCESGLPSLWNARR